MRPMFVFRLLRRTLCGCPLLATISANSLPGRGSGFSDAACSHWVVRESRDCGQAGAAISGHLLQYNGRIQVREVWECGGWEVRKF
jgi:hypothetical protein